MQAEAEAAMSALREEAVGLREALDAQRTQLERHYAGLHAKMRKEYEQVRMLSAARFNTAMCRGQLHVCRACNVLCAPTAATLVA